MKILKIVAIVALVYAGIVTAFESMIGTIQPMPEKTLVITTFDGSGVPHDRVVSRLDSGGKLYVSANHWPRAWYRRALANPDVQATIDGSKGNYRAVPIEGEEADRIDAEHPHPAWFRFMTGYPPRKIVRLEPR
jgi:hypothetical protein